MASPEVAGYGSWRSPITSDVVSSGMVRLIPPVIIDGEDIYWLESRPSEAGRYVVVRHTASGKVTDVNPAPLNARTSVHEYGGGSYLVHEGVVFLSDFGDQRLYRVDSGESARAVTQHPHLRYADGVYDQERDRILCVCEDHRSGGRGVVNSVASVDAQGRGEARVLVSGNDFYAAPRIDPDARRMAWLTWNHPEMPWDGTELWVGDIDGEGAVVNRKKIAGGRDESIGQPRFSPDGSLYFISDRTGWWNLYRWTGSGTVPLWEKEAEFAEPAWNLGLSNYDFLAPDRIVCAYVQEGTSRLAQIRTTDGRVDRIETPYTSIHSLVAGARGVAFLGGSPTEPLAVVHQVIDPPLGESSEGESPAVGGWPGRSPAAAHRPAESQAVADEPGGHGKHVEGFLSPAATQPVRVLRRSTDTSFDEGYLSAPHPVEYSTTGGLTAHALYYPPRNRDFMAPPEERQPLLVISHGGPTSAASSVLNLSLQYWTSRGFAVIDVDYGGSTGYGREYRKRLEGRWGIVDVDDCENAAKHLVEQGLADAERLAIRGGSAGGYTTLAALTFRDAFRAGASYYGVSDLEALTKDTHKFESHYLDRLVGPYPERRDLYVERSPIHHVDRLSCPIIFFQGDEDPVVPPDQAERMADALRRKGLPVAYVLFEGEQHGFRRAENIKRALDAELYFYSRIFDFQLPEPVESVEIENLPGPE